jgi:hypothetical protein
MGSSPGRNVVALASAADLGVVCVQRAAGPSQLAIHLHTGETTLQMNFIHIIWSEIYWEFV